jgi:hypothetical protein
MFGILSHRKRLLYFYYSLNVTNNKKLMLILIPVSANFKKPFVEQNKIALGSTTLCVKIKVFKREGEVNYGVSTTL